jgi:hypothetical protein
VAVAVAVAVAVEPAVAVAVAPAVAVAVSQICHSRAVARTPAACEAPRAIRNRPSVCSAN